LGELMAGKISVVGTFNAVAAGDWPPATMPPSAPPGPANRPHEIPSVCRGRRQRPGLYVSNPCPSRSPKNSRAAGSPPGCSPGRSCATTCAAQMTSVRPAWPSLQPRLRCTTWSATASTCCTKKTSASNRWVRICGMAWSPMAGRPRTSPSLPSRPAVARSTSRRV
jgi:hypothetical protein